MQDSLKNPRSVSDNLALLRSLRVAGYVFLGSAILLFLPVYVTKSLFPTFFLAMACMSLGSYLLSVTWLWGVLRAVANQTDSPGNALDRRKAEQMERFQQWWSFKGHHLRWIAFVLPALLAVAGIVVLCTVYVLGPDIELLLCSMFMLGFAVLLFLTTNHLMGLWWMGS